MARVERMEQKLGQEYRARRVGRRSGAETVGVKTGGGVWVGRGSRLCTLILYTYIPVVTQLAEPLEVKRIADFIIDEFL